MQHLRYNLIVGVSFYKNDKGENRRKSGFVFGTEAGC